MRIHIEAGRLRDRYIAELLIRAAGGVRSGFAALRRSLAQVGPGVSYEAHPID